MRVGEERGNPNFSSVSTFQSKVSSIPHELYAGTYCAMSDL